MTISDERILHIWHTHVGYVTGAPSAQKLPLSDEDKLVFARAVLASEQNAALTLASSRLKEQTARIEVLEEALREASKHLPLAAASWSEEPEYRVHFDAVLALMQRIDAALNNKEQTHG